MRHPINFFLIFFFVLTLVCCRQKPTTATTASCTPTPYDEIGPFYRPNAPLRDKVGAGYFLTGRVMSAQGCQPLESKIEFWLVNEQGEYDAAHRATVLTGNKGAYRFESNRPSDYVGRLPHIHIRVTAAGHEELITQHYPEQNTKTAIFDLVLVPSEK